MAMKNPVHPGVIVREDCMRPLNLSVTECAKMLGIARQTLSSLVNGDEKVSVSIEMAYRLSKAFGSTPRTWLGMQLAFDLAQSQDLEQKIKVKRITAGRKPRNNKERKDNSTVKVKRRVQFSHTLFRALLTIKDASI